MSMEAMLHAAGIRTAAIIDDVYDTVPTAEDLTDSAAWATFLDDVGTDADIIRDAFPAYDGMDADQLQHSNAFVEALWHLKDRLRAELWSTLFDEYVQSAATDRKFLDALDARLKGMGVATKPVGRTKLGELDQEDIVFIDLFLGAAQQAADVKRSINVVKEILKKRPHSPPLVVLMSASAVLGDHKVPFRDDAGLLGAMYRVHSKGDLLVAGSLERVLERLATNLEDGKRVANFIHQLDAGFESAKKRFLVAVRRLDLSDYAHIQELLLSREGQPIGSYMLDVFDRVLQYEMEANEPTISAAQALNALDSKRYPLTHVAGTPDMQDLVNRTIWQHPARLKVASSVAGIPVSFGDLLVKRALVDGQGTLDGTSSEVLLVITPACDLVREDGARSVLLLTGVLADLTPKAWVYTDTPVRTPILILPDGRRMWVKWDLKHPRTFTFPELAAMLATDGGSHRIAMRFRESQVIELQQRFLADVGRVGVIAKMPATFPVRVTASYMNAAGTLVALELPATDTAGAVCYSGQDGDAKSYNKLVLSEPVVDEILLAVGRIDRNAVHTRAQAALDVLQAVTDLPQQLQSGLKVTDTYVAIKVTYENQGQPATQAVGYICRNPAQLPQVVNAALVIQVLDPL